MNERIKELAHQVGLLTYNPSGVPTKLEKFAELIVQECGLHLHKRGVEGFGILEERNLKEHFGVE